jgi:hypothetical protein
METAALSAADLDRIKNFARFWELIVNRGLPLTEAQADVSPLPTPYSLFPIFMSLSDALLARFGRNWGIDKAELTAAVDDLYGGKSCK